MLEILEQFIEKLDSAVDRILEFLTGHGYRVREVRVRIPDARRMVEAIQVRRQSTSGLPCDRY